MTASIISQLPLMAGSALLGTLGRAGQWTFSRYMRAPLASTGILAMVTLTAFAGSNALYFQTGQHPSPFFAPAREAVTPLPTPAAERVSQPAQRAIQPLPEPIAEPVTSAETTGSVAPLPTGPVGNSQMFEVQKKLAELKLFNGKVDGYYGPRTAQAIRTFEQRNGMKPTGSTDSRVLEAILSSDSAGRVTQAVAPEPQARAVPAEQPAPVVQQAALAVAPAPVVQPVPAQADQVVAQLPALSPAEAVFDDVAQTAASTIDSIIAAVDTPRPTSNQPVANPPVPVATLPVAQPMPQPVQVAQVAKPVVAVPEPQPQQALRAPAEPAPYVPPATDAALVSQIQRGLSSLGFYRAAVDGKPSAETARAIREFENFYSYEMTGQVKPDLVELLLKAGAVI